VDHDPSPPPSFWRSAAGVALCAAMVPIGFYLLAEHRAHVFGVLPYLLVAACPLMHLFMHHGHGGHGGHGGQRDSTPSRSHDDDRAR
jgi:hypothetical protein